MENGYTARINRVIDYIDRNIGKPLCLEELAEVACFSKYHFHRIFASMTGETLYQFILRLRLEKAAALLLLKRDLSVTAIAFDCGFSDSAVFARNFRNMFGISASEWRKNKKGDSFSGTSTSAGLKDGRQSIAAGRRPGTDIVKPFGGEKEIEIRKLPDIQVAYIRHTGPYKGDPDLFAGLYRQLFSWAGSRGLLDGKEIETMVIYHDTPEITKDEQLRISVCLPVDSSVEGDGEIGRMEIPGGEYAFIPFLLAVDEYQAAWNWVYCSWLPVCGYEPDDRAVFEYYPGQKDCPKGKTRVSICVPVKPLNGKNRL